MSGHTLFATLKRKREIDEGLTHYWCCDENVALCGESLTGDSDDVVDCLVCIDLEENYEPCPAPGCPIRLDKADT